MKKYICPICKNEDHTDEAQYCKICGAEIIDKKFTNPFKFSNGKLVDVRDSYMGDYIRVQIGRKPVDENDSTVITTLPDKIWDNADKYEEIRQVLGKDDNLVRVVDTFTVAKRVNRVIPKDVDKYDEPVAINCTYKTKLEILLNRDGYKARYYLDWTGNVDFYNYVTSFMLDEFWEKLNSGKLSGANKYCDSDGDDSYISITLYSDNGDYYEQDIYNESELEGFIAGVRVVEFEYKIVS